MYRVIKGNSDSDRALVGKRDGHPFLARLKTLLFHAKNHSDWQNGMYLGGCAKAERKRKRNEGDIRRVRTRGVSERGVRYSIGYYTHLGTCSVGHSGAS